MSLRLAVAVLALSSFAVAQHGGGGGRPAGAGAGMGAGSSMGASMGASHGTGMSGDRGNNAQPGTMNSGK